MPLHLARRRRFVEDHLRSAARYLRATGIVGLASVVTSKLLRTTRLQAVRRNDVRHPFHLRIPSSDVATYCEVFLERDYAFDVPRSPRVIVDGGANVGLSSIFFANRFPEARIIAVEPESSNFELLVANVAPYPQITPLQAALWHENKRISLVDPGSGKWGFITRDQSESTLANTQNELVRALTLDRLMDEYGLDHIDLLKLDIEGAEREVFGKPGAWLDRVDAVLVELHDRLQPGCSRNFYVATRAFELEWSKGMVVGVARERSAVVGASDRRVEATSHPAL